jgi:hypothetical protein
MGVPKLIYKNQKRGGKHCNAYQYKNGIIIYRFPTNPPNVHKNDTVYTNDISVTDLMKIIMEFSTGDKCVETPQPTTTDNVKVTRFNMQRRVQKDHNKSTRRAQDTDVHCTGQLGDKPQHC